MKTTALLLLDLQNEMVDPAGKVGGSGLAKVVDERGILPRAVAVREAVSRTGGTVAYVRLGFRPDYADALSVAPRVARMEEHGACVLGTWGTEFPSILAPRAGELVFTKQCVNPFFNTGLMTWLLRRGLTHVVLGGVVTNLVVEATARAADDAGFQVTVLEDLCAAPNPVWHQFSVENMLPLFASVKQTDAFLSDLPPC